MSCLYTIGHSNLESTRFIELLQSNQVETLIDVRTSPFSRYSPHFNRQPLEKLLGRERIAYRFHGDKLGGRPSDPACYEAGRVDYERVAAKTWFEEGITRALNDIGNSTAAFMCSEKDPVNCHRFLLLARRLATQGREISHIHHDGHLERHSDAESRLFGISRVPADDMFQDHSVLLAKAYKIQADKVSYVADGE